jgi:hypothetical protein
MATPLISEEWRPVEGFTGYDVSSLGRVRSWRRQGAAKTFRDIPRIMSAAPDPDGYPSVWLYGSGPRVYRRVHILVALAFIGLRPTGQECRHLNCDHTDPRAINLAWGTASENHMDSVRNGTHTCFTKIGEGNAFAKLTEVKVRQIRDICAGGGLSYSRIGKQFGVSQQTIARIHRRETWAYLKDS